MVEKTKNKKKQNTKLKLLFISYHKILIGIMVILMLVLNYYFVLEPKYRQVSSGGSFNSESLQTEVAKRQQYLDQLKELSKNYRQLTQADIAKLQNILPAEADFPGLFVQIAELAKANDVFLAGIMINEGAEASQPKSDVEKISRLSINLSFIGNSIDPYDELKQLLAALESNLRLFDVEAVYFTPGSNDYSINLATYYYKNN